MFCVCKFAGKTWMLGAKVSGWQFLPYYQSTTIYCMSLAGQLKVFAKKTFIKFLILWTFKFCLPQECTSILSTSRSVQNRILENSWLWIFSILLKFRLDRCIRRPMRAIASCDMQMKRRAEVKFLRSYKGQTGINIPRSRLALARTQPLIERHPPETIWMRNFRNHLKLIL